MSLSPLIALNEQFQKHIEEYGSAIQPSHIICLRDKFSDVNRTVIKIATEQCELMTQQLELQAEIDALRAKMTYFKQENDVLRKLLLEYKQAILNTTLEDIEVNILTLLAKEEGLIINQIAGDLHTSPYIIEFLLQKLIDHKMIYASFPSGYPSEYYIDDKGRKYLIENNLIT